MQIPPLHLATGTTDLSLVSISTYMTSINNKSCVQEIQDIDQGPVEWSSKSETIQQCFKYVLAHRLFIHKLDIFFQQTILQLYT